MNRRTVRFLLLTSVIAAMTAGPAAAVSDPDPFPAGACVRVTLVDPKPLCVIVDPTP